MQPGQTELRHIRDNAVQLYASSDIHAALDRMAGEISAVLENSLPIVLCVLTGGIIPTGHLLTRLSFPLETDYLHATRYRGETSGREVQWVSGPGIDLAGRTILVVDDILDEGNTLADVIAFCKASGAGRVYSAVLVEKCHNRRVTGVRADFVGLQAEDRYLFGFGMDYKGFLRNVDGIFAVAADDDNMNRKG